MKMEINLTERDNWKYGNGDTQISKPVNNIKEQKQVENLKSKFDELFAS